MVDLPGWYEDEYYKPTQDYLFPYGKGLLEGDIPEYFRPIGERGGREFEDMLGMVKRDISRGIDEDLVRRNVSRGGVGTQVKGQAFADASTKARYDDFLRAMRGREMFLGTGLKTVSGVRGAGLQYQGQRNTFNINRAKLQMADEHFQKKMDYQKKQASDRAWGSMLSSGLGALGTVAGMFLPGFGAAAGATSGGGRGSAVGVTPAFDYYTPDDVGMRGMEDYYPSYGEYRERDYLSSFYR